MFSNATEYDVWWHNVCKNCKGDIHSNCPIILDLLLLGQNDAVVRNGPRLEDIVCQSFDPIGK